MRRNYSSLCLALPEACLSSYYTGEVRKCIIFKDGYAGEIAVYGNKFCQSDESKTWQLQCWELQRFRSFCHWQDG